MNKTLVILVLLLIPGATAAADDAGTPVSEAALHFRLEVGVESVRAVAGFVDESKGTGTGYDTACLDLDADGRPESKQVFSMKRVYGQEQEVVDPKIRIEHEDAAWVLELYSLGLRRPVAKDGRVRTFIHWSVTKGDLYAWFINGRVTLFTDAAAAENELSISLGRHLAFEVTSGMQGPKAMLNVGLKDPNDCTLRLARVGKEMRKPNVVLRQCCCEQLNTDLEYG